MGSAVQVADLFFRVGRILEYDWSRSIWFMINPPIALYYMQGLNTTPLHGHAALFGVYGMLGIGLMLVCLRVGPRCGVEERVVKDRLLGHERGFDGDVLAESASGWIDADLGLGRTRLLVRPQF